MASRLTFGDFQSSSDLDHNANIMAVRFGFGPRLAETIEGTMPHAPAETYKASLSHTAKTPSFGYILESSHQKRFQACHGSLYHQLDCSHRIRTDLVEQCGSNCLQSTHLQPIYCQDCVNQDADRIWRNREIELNNMYPIIDQMTKEQHGQWYQQHCHLRNNHSRDRLAHEAQLKARARPAHQCLGIEACKEDIDLATSLHSFNISGQSEKTRNHQGTSLRRHRVNLPSDPSERLHWTLDQVNLMSGTCAQQFSAVQPGHISNRLATGFDEDEEL